MIETTNKTAIKSAGWYIVSNFFLKGITFFTLPIFARLLAHSEFGQFSNYSAWLQIMTIIVTLNIQAALISAIYEFKEKIEEFTLSIFSLSTMFVIIWGILLNVFQDFFTNFFDLEIHYINYMIIYLFFSSALSIFQLKTRLLFKYKANVIISITTAILTEVLSVILVYVLADKLHGRIIGTVIPMAIIGVGLIIYFLKKGQIINLAYWKYALKVCIPYMFHYLMMHLLHG